MVRYLNPVSLPIFLVFILTVPYFLDVHGDTVFWDDGGGDHKWGNKFNWSGDLLPQIDDNIFIDQNENNVAYVIIDNDVTLNGTLTIDSGVVNGQRDYLQIPDGVQLTVLEGGEIRNGGNITNLGYLTNFGGSIENGPGSIMHIEGLLYSIDGIFENQGLFQNFGDINFTATKFTNEEFGSIKNTQGGMLRINPRSNITNFDIIENSRNGIIHNEGKILNFGSLLNTDAALLENPFGIINNTEVGIITNSKTSTISNDHLIENEGTILNECGSTIFGTGLIVGNPVISECDSDFDGIWDSVDLLPFTPSLNFRDNNIPIPTLGEIKSKGDQKLTIRDFPDRSKGVLISADEFGGSTPAEIFVCGSTTIFLDANESIIVTCSSVTLEVIQGPIEVKFTSFNCAEYSATLNSGTSITFFPETSIVYAYPQNPEDIIVTSIGQQVVIHPGEQVDLSTAPIPPLERVPASNLRIVNAFGNSVNSVLVNQQIQITADLTNAQNIDQDFAFLIQIQDESGVTVSLSWISGSIVPCQFMSPAHSWIPTSSGTYSVVIFVWNSLDNPTALSAPLSISIDVT